jgi:hypothetical protein
MSLTAAWKRSPRSDSACIRPYQVLHLHTEIGIGELMRFVRNYQRAILKMIEEKRNLKMWDGTIPEERSV